MEKNVRGASGSLDMTVGSPYGLMIRFALPLMFSQIFQQLYNTADSLIVGNCLGTEELAAVSSSGPMIFLMVSFFEGVFLGAGVLISRYFGEKNENAVSRAVHTAFAVALASGVFLTAVGITLTPTLLKWINTDPDVMPLAVSYFRVYFTGSMAFVLYSVSRGVMMAVGDSRRPLVYLIVSSLLNIALDLLFVKVFGWGVWAAALATVISQIVSAALCLSRLLRKGGVVSLSIGKIRFHRDMLGMIIRYGLPSGVQNSVISLANILVQSQINIFGKYAMAAYGTHIKIEGFAFLPITSFNMAISTYIGQNLGAKKYDRAKTGARFGIISSVVLAGTVGVAYFFLAPHLFALFDRTPQVIAYGVRQAQTIALFYFILAYSHSVAAVCRGAGKAFVPMFVMLAVWCVFRIAYIFVVMNVFHDVGYVYMAYPITWVISSVIYFIYYHASDWVHGFDREKQNKRSRT
ncbi:MAG: MATE family efflux transporter [Clostridia bacterium]|nr:MATE family efflux transporter [Clostridia bacterium]